MLLYYFRNGEKSLDASKNDLAEIITPAAV